MKRKILEKIVSAAIILSMAILTAVQAYASENEATNTKKPSKTEKTEATEISETETSETETSETEAETTAAETAVTIPAFTEEPPDIYGNAELVEKQEIIFSNGTFEFLSVTTKAGNAFYIFIRRDNEEGIANVYFLNKVDERDLYDVIYQTTENTGEGESEGTESGVSESSGQDQEPAVTTPAGGTQTKPAKKISIPKSGIIISVIAVVLIGGYLLFNYLSGKKKTSKSRDFRDDNDDDGGDGDEYEDDEVFVSDED